MSTNRLIISAIIAILFAPVCLIARPACPNPIKVRQPDGSVVTIKLEGDEFSHRTLMNGVKCRQDNRGFWVEATANATKSAISSGPRMTRSNAQPRMAASDIRAGKKKFLILLVEFSDIKMTFENSNFNRLMNEVGYNDFYATGSVRDYFVKNSNGAFTPQFDVIGPVTLKKPCSYYGADDKESGTHDIRAYEAIKDACEIADANGLVNFADYDIDSDGKVDNVYMFYAGYSQSESAVENNIWPHAWYLQSGAGITLTLDGKTIDRYACSSELSGYAGKNLSGIGGFCHEFSHILGLPDLYDTDYEESGGEGEGVSCWSLMGSGSYLNDSKTPPHYIGLERERLGWATLTQLKATGSVEFEAIYNNKCYYTSTDTNGETFVYEYRDGTGWDAYLPKGLAVYHLDASNRDVNGMKASERWSSGYGINSCYTHQCCYLVASSPSVSVKEDYPFPGTKSVRSFEGVGWSGNQTGYRLENIRVDGDKMAASLTIAANKRLSGTVYGSDGHPIESADVTIVPAGQDTKSSFGRYVVKPLVATSNSAYHARTSANGYFSIDLAGVVQTSFSVTVSCRGYIGQEETITIGNAALSRDYVLNPINYFGFSKYFLYKFKSSTIEDAVYYLEWKEAMDDYAVGVRFSSTDLRNLVGARVDSVLFASPAEKVGEVYLTIDAGNRNKPLLKKSVPLNGYVPNGYTRVGISDESFTVPSGENLVFGFRIKGSKETKFALISTDKEKGGMLYSFDDYDWEEYSDGCALIVVKFTKTESSISSAGINVISVPSELKAGDMLSFDLTESEFSKTFSVQWKFDGQDVSAPVSLTSGEHLIVAELTYSDGSRETIERWINVV